MHAGYRRSAARPPAERAGVEPRWKTRRSAPHLFPTPVTPRRDRTGLEPSGGLGFVGSVQHPRLGVSLDLLIRTGAQRGSRVRLLRSPLVV